MQGLRHESDRSDPAHSSQQQWSSFGPDVESQPLAHYRVRLSELKDIKLAKY